MFVKMRTTMAGPDGSANAGEVVEVADDHGKELVEGGFAEKCDAPARLTPRKVERATRRAKEDASGKPQGGGKDGGKDGGKG